MEEHYILILLFILVKLIIISFNIILQTLEEEYISPLLIIVKF